MRSKAALAIASVLAIGGIAAGCGSDDDDATTVARISKSEFIAKADQICKQADRQLGKAGSALGDHPSQAQLTDFSNNTLIPNVQGQIDGVRALGLPSVDEEQVNSFLTAAQSAVDRLKADPSLVEDDSLFNETRAKAELIGLKVCAQGD